MGAYKTLENLRARIPVGDWPKSCLQANCEFTKMSPLNLSVHKDQFGDKADAMQNEFKKPGSYRIF